MLTAQDITGLYAIIPTPARAGADRLDARNTVDLEQTASLVEALIRDGASGLIALGTTGECATLSQPDFRTFAGHLLDVIGGRVPVFIGSTALGGHDAAERMRFLAQNKADGTLLGLPMWQPVSTVMAVDFYRQTSECFPSLGVMVYANSRAFRYSYPTDFWAAVTEQAATVVAAKYSRPPDLTELIAVTRGRINVMPNETTAADFYAQSPGTTTAIWATAAAMGPAPAVALMNAIQSRDAGQVASVSAELAWANEPVGPIFNDKAVFATYNIQVEKARINAAGYCACGPCRPPYNHLPDDYAAAARECGERWRSLHHKYRQAG